MYFPIGNQLKILLLFS